MAAYAAAKTFSQKGLAAQVTVLEKMPRVGRKIMLTGKGRCNFTNLKDWNEFSTRVRSNPNFLKPAFFNMPPRSVIDFFEEYGMKTVVERGDRAFPLSYHAGDVVDTLLAACRSLGVKVETEAEVRGIVAGAGSAGACGEGFGSGGSGWAVTLSDGRTYLCSRVIVATGGLSYPSTGSTGDGLTWASGLGIGVTPVFPSLTALVPAGYKAGDSGSGTFVHQDTPLSGLGEKLCGISLKNVGVQLVIEGSVAGSEFGDVDFTDGGVEGPVGFQLSRKAVKAMLNGSRVALVLDLKPGVGLTELTVRVKELWSEVDRDPRSARLREKDKAKVLLGKLMPRELVAPFVECNPGVFTLERKGRTDTKLWVNLPTIARCLKEWRFDLVGHVGYERCVVTAGGVSVDEVVAKTLESRRCPGLYFCGEVLDADADTGGYNLQIAFSTGALAGRSAAVSISE